MKDVRGKLLELGDDIIYTYWNCSDMYVGKIVRITPKTIIVESKFVGAYSIRKSNLNHRIVKI